jgi:hypothetical protein
MLRRTLAVAALLALTGCTTIPKQQQRLSSALVGQPVAALKARFGASSGYGNKVTHYRWDVDGLTADWAGMFTAGHTTSSASGVVDGRPFSGTVSTPDGYSSGSGGATHCALIVKTDDSGIVTDVDVWGDASACRKFS